MKTMFECQLRLRMQLKDGDKLLHRAWLCKTTSFAWPVTADQFIDLGDGDMDSMHELQVNFVRQTTGALLPAVFLRDYITADPKLCGDMCTWLCEHGWRKLEE